ncbi:MAG: aminotransferase class V-fold PLP-dependent enzyme [Candidatus Eisenbacteria bacterium]
MIPEPLTFERLRAEIVGADTLIPTPFGEKPMVYCDYTASGRCLSFVERYLQQVQRHYANTHTEDDMTGRTMTRLLRQAEAAIKDAVNAGPDGRIVACGTGSSGAIEKLQQIVGTALPPATRRVLLNALRLAFPPDRIEEIEGAIVQRAPVVFVGPFEHHSNEVTWRQGFAIVVEVRLCQDGGVDLQHLEELLQDPRYQGRLRIGSFSAASNVTGMRTPVHEIARLLHRYEAIACFDYAASAPYVEIDMNPAPRPGEEGDPSLDAIFISPHKFLGGPGSSGVLVFNRRIYHSDLPPTVGGGGTVEYVSPEGQEYFADIEEREKSGTPGVIQIMKAALAFLVKDAIGAEQIEEREQELLDRAFERWRDHPRVEILGNPDPRRRIGIVSFNLKSSNGRYLHPKLVTALLNDLFGIQSRAGCSCAGPYGHRLLGIDLEHSERYRHWIMKGFTGIKPGWCRIGFHYTMEDAEAEYVMDAVEFVAEHGERFVPLYRFDLHTGAWTHGSDAGPTEEFSLRKALAHGTPPRVADAMERSARYRRCLEEAHELAESLSAEVCDASLDGELGVLQFFCMH